MGSSHRHLLRLLDDPFFPFPPPSFSSSSCPFPPSPFAFPPHDLNDLDLFLPPPHPIDPFFPAPPSPHAFLLHDLTDRVAALAARAGAGAPQPARRKYTYASQSPGGRKVKWTAEEKPRSGDRSLRWEAELASPNEDGFDRKWKWETKSKAAGKAKTKWGTEIKGKGSLEPWSHAYTWEEHFSGSDDDDDDQEEVEERYHRKPEKKEKKKIKPAAAKEDKKKKTKCVQIEEIPDDNPAGCDAIRKVSKVSGPI